MIKLLKIFYLTFILFCVASFNLKAIANESNFGIDLGYGFLDIGADDTAQTIANISGSTVTASYDLGSWFGRIYADYKISDSTYLDVGFFMTGDVSATYTLSGATASESYSANGIDFAAVIKENDKEGLFLKVECTLVQ